MSYSTTTQAFLDEMSKHNSNNIPKLLLPKVTLGGKEDDGRFYIINRTPEGRFEKDKKIFGDNDGHLFHGVILRVAYFAKWKYKENAKKTFQTREFTDWKNEALELMEITYGEEGGTKIIKTFPNWEQFKLACLKVDDLTGNPLPMPYDLCASLYVCHLATGSTIKVEIKGSNVSEWFEFKNTALKKFPEDIRPTTLLQVLTSFKSIKRSNEKTGAGYYGIEFGIASVCNEEQMQVVIPAYKAVDEWAKAWKKKQAEDKEELPQMTLTTDRETPATEIDTLKALAATQPKEPEIDMNQIPF